MQTPRLDRPLAGFERALDVRSRARAPVEVALDELRALRDVDAVAPPEAAATIESLAARFALRPAGADRLRLPQPTAHDGRSVRVALGRVLAADASAASPDREAVIKDERMRRALRAVDAAMSLIRGEQKVSG